jgi:hypothetical protein
MKSPSRFLSISVLGILFWPIAVHSQNSAKDITCQDGSGEYSTRFSTGVSVVVGPIRNGSFAQRACAAKLIWNEQEIPVTADADQVGIDVLGADLGFGKPVVAFQIDDTGAGANRTYKIYSLAKHPQLLYTIKGANSYRAADTDLDGRVEVWTDDAVAVDGFEGVPGADLDFPPTVVIRFEKGRPVDVGSEFLSYYDAQVAKLRSQVSERDLAEFKQSDGDLSARKPQSSGELHRLARTKISVLEIVWAYLYSGRQQEAWSALRDMWPARDLERIRTSVTNVHESGILHNIDRSRRSSSGKGGGKVYDAIGTSVVVNTYTPYSRNGGAPPDTQAESPIVQPKSILLRRPPPSTDGNVPSANEAIELVVDAAGKVSSAKVLNGVDGSLVQASAGWQFIPAFRDGRPVACRFRLSIWALK